MRYFTAAEIVPAFLFSVLVLSSCFSSSSPAPAAASSGGAVWSATVDGKPVSGTTTDGAARTSLHEDATIDGVNFTLGYSGGKEGFQFLVNRAGRTELKEEDNTTVCNYRRADGTMYVAQAATVIINATGPRTSGIFSGTWKNAHYGRATGNAPETIVVSDGKFDLP